ncbi:MAG: hypothetical protein HKN43_09410 [Rhodothermales bacterium]|nr:hypothetical protein [Rhodothermales bacterium]
MHFETLSFSIQEDHIAVVTINRPEKLNALNAEVIDDLDACFSALQADPTVRVVILTGTGEKAFVAGADIQQFTTLTTASATAFARRGQGVFNLIESLGKPVIAAVNGFALGGGCELALSCHVRIASSNARFGQPEVKLGVIPGYGGTQRLPRVVGHGIATEMIITGGMVDAERALNIGLVSKVVEQDQLLETALEMARTIASNAPVAVRLSLESIANSTLPSGVGMDAEAELFGNAFDTDDVKEGVTAFLEKRAANFSGS